MKKNLVGNIKRKSFLKTKKHRKIDKKLKKKKHNLKETCRMGQLQK